MIELPKSFWSKHVRFTEYDIYETALEDIEYFLKENIHKSARVSAREYTYYVSFIDPKYETLLILKYSDNDLCYS